VYAPFDALTDAGIFRGSARRLGPNVVALGSLTKAYGLGMLRVGWVLAAPAVVARADDVLLATLGHLPLAHAAVGAAALTEIEAYAARARALVAGRRERVEAWIATRREAQWSAPTEGVFGLVTLPGRGDLTPAIEHLATEKGVLVAAGSFFGAPSSFRLSWASTPELDRSLELLSYMVG